MKRQSAIKSVRIKSELFLLVLRHGWIGTAIFGLLSLLFSKPKWILIPIAVFGIFITAMYRVSRKYQDRKSRKIEFSVLCTVLPLIFMPAFFLLGGGLKGGNFLLYMLSSFTSVLLMDGWILISNLILHAISFTAVMVFGYLHPSVIMLFCATDSRIEYVMITAAFLYAGWSIGSALSMIMRNFRESQKMATELLRQITDTTVRDPLSGAYNRGYLVDCLNKHIAAAEDGTGSVFSIIMFDLDHFKDINDKYGHLAGDECIRTLARTIKDSLRSSDIVARYGGEEFVCVLPGAADTPAYRRAEAIRKKLEQTHLSGRVDVPITISGGVAMYRPGMTSAQLISVADEYLYLAKRRGRNQIVWRAGELSPDPNEVLHGTIFTAEHHPGRRSTDRDDEK